MSYIVQIVCDIGHRHQVTMMSCHSNRHTKSPMIHGEGLTPDAAIAGLHAEAQKAGWVFYPEYESHEIWLCPACREVFTFSRDCEPASEIIQDKGGQHDK